jgi:UDP-glucose 4-epimerase
MSVEGLRVLVTGAAGFVPSHVVDAYVAAGARVTALDNFSDGRRADLAALSGEHEIVEMDVRDESIPKIIKQQDIVVHMAANADVPRSVRNPDYDFQNNVTGSYNVLRACLDSNVQSVIFASSAAVYGEPNYTPIDETHPLDPVSPYGAAKLAVEKLGFSYYKAFGLPFSAIRIFNSYGIRQPRYVMYDLLRKLRHDPRRLEVLGTGNQVRDYSYVTDTARCFLLVAKNKGAIGEVYNVAGGEPISIKDLAKRLISALGLSEVNVVFTGQSWPGDITALVADISKIRTDLGYCPEVTLEEGIIRLVRWFDERHSMTAMASCNGRFSGDKGEVTGSPW